MADLTADIKRLQERGNPLLRNEFGYPTAPSVNIYLGSLLEVNAAGQAQPMGVAGGVAFIGVSDRQVLNSLSTSPGAPVTPMRRTLGLTVPSATYANIGAPVYAAGTDDNTLTLTQTGSLVQIGTLVGIVNGQTFVSIIGS